MATVNLGRIKSVWRGTWVTGTAYVKDDVVQSGVNSYICVTAHTAGATFAGDSANWELMVQGAEIPSQTGNAGKALVTDGTSLSWGDGGAILQVQTYQFPNVDVSTTSGSPQLYQTVSFTPKSASSTLIFSHNVHSEFDRGNMDGTSSYIRLTRDGGAEDNIIRQWADGARHAGGVNHEYMTRTRQAFSASPSTGTHEFKLWYWSDNGRNFWVNRPLTGNGASSWLSIMEVA